MNQSKRTHQINLVFAGVDVPYTIYILFLSSSFFSSFLYTHRAFCTNLFKQVLVGFFCLPAFYLFCHSLKRVSRPPEKQETHPNTLVKSSSGDFFFRQHSFLQACPGKINPILSQHSCSKSTPLTIGATPQHFDKALWLMPIPQKA